MFNWRFIIILYFNVHLIGISVTHASDRLELYSLSNSLKNNQITSIFDLHILNQKYYALGFDGFNNNESKRPKARVYRVFFPIFKYTNNINAGHIKQAFELGDFRVTSDNDHLAKSGLVIGGGFIARAKKFYDRGRYFDIKLKGSLAAAPSHKWIKQREQTLIACSKNYLSQWIFFDLCSSWLYNEQQLANYSSYATSAHLTKIFSADSAFYETQLGIKQLKTVDYQQSQLLSRLSSIRTSGLKTNLEFHIGDEILNAHALKYRISIDLSKKINKKKVSLLYEQRGYEGGSFLNLPRKDIFNHWALSYPLWNTFEIIIGYTKNKSNINFFTSNSPYVSLSLPPWEF